MSDIDIWGEEGGRMLRLTRQPNEEVLFEIIEPNGTAAPAVIGSVTIAGFRQPRIAMFLKGEPS